MGSKTKKHTTNRDRSRFLYLTKRFSRIGVGVLTLLVGGVLLFLTGQDWLMGFTSLNWITTQGQIITSQSVPCQRKYDFGNSLRAKIIYEYRVNSVSYSSSNLTFTTDSLFFFDCGNPDKVLNLYPVGMTVVVYYDPKKPENSVLRPGGTSFAGIGFSLIIFISGAITLLLDKSAFRKAKRNKKQGS